MVRACGRVEEEERVVELVKRCAAPSQLKQVYGYVIASGQSQNNFIGAKLVRSFAAFGCLELARAIAEAIDHPNAFVWTALIRGYSESDTNGSPREALHLYKKMREYPETKPLTFTFSSALKSCAKLLALEEGKQIHAHAFKHGFRLDPRVQTTLIDLYGKCKHLAEARQVFDKVIAAGVNDVQVWNTMIAMYAEAGEMEMAHELFAGMPERNTFTWVKMIGGYASLAQMDSARRLFKLANSHNVVMDTAMITGYARSGDIAAARSVFDEMNEHDIACWNAMISAYLHAGLNDEALDLFKLMLSSSGEKKVEPNHVTIATIASACAQSGSFRLAHWIQDYVDCQGSMLLNNHTVAALIDLHCKCGDLKHAYNLFTRWKLKDLICYSSMISGFGIHGHGKDAIAVFESLRQAELEPDAICFLSVLTACSHSRMLSEGRRYFQMMRDEYGIHPSADHYMCMVDLLGRAGHIIEAYKLITEDMPQGVRPHAGIWGALLSACRIYSNVEVGEVAAKHLMDLEPENAGNYVLLSNIYAKAQRWEGVARVRALMRSRGMRKPPGWSSAEVGSSLRRFLTGEAYDVRLEYVLELLDWELKSYGYFTRIQEHE